MNDDLISRQAAITALSNEIVKRRLLDEMYDGCIDEFQTKEILKKLPPAQPEPHWIPVTQDTPTEDGDYWATFEAETGRFVDWASWYQGRWVVWIDGSPASLSNVIAWQKCPEPYKEVKE